MQLDPTVLRPPFVGLIVSHRLAFAFAFAGEFAEASPGSANTPRRCWPTFRRPLVIGITADAVGVTHDPDAGDIGMAELAHQPIELASSICGEVGFVEIEQYLAGVVEGDDLASRCFRLHGRGAGRVLRHRATVMLDGGGRRIGTTVATVEHPVVVFIAILGVADQTTAQQSQCGAVNGQPLLSMAPNPPPTKPPIRLQIGQVR